MKLCECGCGEPVTRERNRFLPSHNLRKLRTSPLQRFWSNVTVANPDDCWEWRGAASGGYGKINVDGKEMLAHRYSYQLHYGLIPDGLWVLHRCDNPPCVNPNHLFLGTNDDNIADMRAKQRHSCGERTGGSRLTNAQVREILALFAVYSSGEFSKEFIARMYGVTDMTIGNIIRRTTWTHIEVPDTSTGMGIVERFTDENNTRIARLIDAEQYLPIVVGKHGHRVHWGCPSDERDKTGLRLYHNICGATNTRNTSKPPIIRVLSANAEVNCMRCQIEISQRAVNAAAYAETSAYLVKNGVAR